MLDAMRVLAEQVGCHDLNHGLGRTLPAVDTALTYADCAVLAMDTQEQPAVPQDSFNVLNLGGFCHGWPPLCRFSHTGGARSGICVLAMDESYSHVPSVCYHHRAGIGYADPHPR